MQKFYDMRVNSSDDQRNRMLTSLCGFIACVGNAQEVYATPPARRWLRLYIRGCKWSVLKEDIPINSVDDNELNCDVVSGIMELLRMHTQTVTSGYECLELLEQGSASTVFCQN